MRKKLTVKNLLTLVIFISIVSSLALFDLFSPSTVLSAQTTEGDLRIKDGDMILSNNYFYRAKATGGEERRVFGLNASNNLIIGGTHLGTLRFDSGGSTGSLYIGGDSGNVGLGTTNPQAGLHVNTGDVLINNNNFYRAQAAEGANRRVFGLDTSNSLIIGGTNLNDIRFDGGNNKGALFIESNSGNTGIGTTNPTSDFHLKRDTDAVFTIEADQNNTNENNHPQLELKQDGGSTVGRLGFFDGTNDLKLQNGSSNAKIELKNNGDICIGVCN